MKAECDFLPREDGGVTLKVNLPDGIVIKTIKEVHVTSKGMGLTVIRER